MILTWDVVFILSITSTIFINPVNTVLSETGLEGTKKLIKTVCKNKSQVKESDLALVRSGTFSENQELHCYMSCALTMMKVMQSGKIDVDSAKRQLHALMPERFRAPMTEQLEKCKDAEGLDACSVAANFVKCSYDVNPESTVIPL